MKAGNASVKKPAGRRPVVFLFDIDNTLLDNDRVQVDLQAHLVQAAGPAGARRYWAVFEQLRRQLGYADYLGALERYRALRPHDFGMLAVARFLLHYPFARRLFPHSLRVIAWARRRGLAAVLSDGDAVFQPHKAEISGLAAAVGGRVMIYVHKEKELADVARRHPARHYVVVDDKLRILTAIKKIWGRRATTVFVRQGRYALDTRSIAKFPPADVTLERIGDLLRCDSDSLVAAGRGPR